MKKKSKRFQGNLKQMQEADKTAGKEVTGDKRYYTLAEAVDVLKKLPPVKFDATVGVSIRLNVDLKKAEQAMRGSISLPKGIGKTRKVIVFGTGNEAEQARASGADEVGLDDLIKKIEGGWVDFDVAICPPGLMRQVSRLGKILGPSGKMPSPKGGTVTDEIALAVKEFKAGKVEFRTDATGIIHMPCGKLSFSAEDLLLNINAAIEHIKSHRPAGVKGDFIRSLTISSTMSPGLAIKTK